MQTKEYTSEEMQHGYLSDKGLTAAERKARALIRCGVFFPKYPAYFTVAVYATF